MRHPSLALALAFALQSSACRSTATAPASAIVPGTTSVDSLVVAGRVRTYLAHVPIGASSGAALPLLIAFHGAGGDGADMATLVGTGDADRYGYLAVFPDAATGTHSTWALGCANCTWADAAGVDDFRFVSELLDTLAARFPVDPGRVYVTGFSLGGSMAYDVACRFSGQLAGAAIVASLPSPEELAGCDVRRPLRILIMNGDADPNIPWGGGGENAYLSADSAAALWRTWNHGGGAVSLVRIAGGGHMWRSASFDATTRLSQTFMRGSP